MQSYQYSLFSWAQDGISVMSKLFYTVKMVHLCQCGPVTPWTVQAAAGHLSIHKPHAGPIPGA